MQGLILICYGGHIWSHIDLLRWPHLIYTDVEGSVSSERLGSDNGIEHLNGTLLNLLLLPGDDDLCGVEARVRGALLPEHMANVI